MATKRQYRSEALGAIYETMEALDSIGAINKITMREFGEACLEPVQELKPEAIRALRERENALRSCSFISTIALDRYSTVSKP